MNNNTIMFSLKLQNFLTPEILKAGNASTSTFTKMSQYAQQATGKNQILGMSFGELQSKIKQTEDLINKSTIPKQINDAKRELTELQRMAVKHPGAMNNSNPGSSKSSGIGIGGVAIGSMLGGLYTQGLSMVKDGIGAMVSKSMDKETAINGISTFIGKQGANEAYNNIRKDAQETPFDTASLLQVNRALISTGLNAKDARTDSMNLANAIVAVGGGNDELTRMAANMQQIRTVGKASAMDIKQFGMAGINIYALLAKATGKSIDQAKEMDVSYELLSKAMAMSREKGGMYAGALELAQNSKQGKWSNIKEAMSNSLADIGTALSPIIEIFLNLGNKFANSIAPMLEKAKPYIDAISNGISTAVDYISNMASSTGEWGSYVATIKEFFNHMWGIIQHIAIKLWAMVSSMIEFIKKSEIMKDIFKFVMGIAQMIGDIISAMVDAVVWAWEHVLKPIFEALDSFWKWLKGTDGIEVKGSKTVKIEIPKTKPAPTPAPAPTSGTSLAMNNGNAGKQAGESVMGGGPKSITINVGKFFDSIQFTTMNGAESAQELEKVVLEALGRVLYNGAKLV